MKNFLKQFLTKNLTFLRGLFKIPQTREVSTMPIHEAKETKKPITDSLTCPYCNSQQFQRRGFRQNIHEKIQLYLCQNCNKTFTQKEVKGKHYPLSIIFDAISIFNLGYSLEETCRIMEKRMLKNDKFLSSRIPNEIQNAKNENSQLDIKKLDNEVSLEIRNLKFEINNIIQPSTLSTWLVEFAEYIKFSRMRDYAMKLYPPKDQIIHATLAHQQLYRYMFHKAKAELIIKGDFEHRNYWPLKEFLEAIPYECPHQYFMEGLRASEAPLTFSKKQMIVRSKTNYANKITAFVLQSVTDRKSRHEALQKFMLANDSVTVAAEVPVYLTKDDLLHMQTQLGFEIYEKNDKFLSDQIPNEIQNDKNENSQLDIKKLNKNVSLEIRNSKLEIPKLITGHIDMIQIRNGQIHILDYKPNAAKERPIEQLTLYAMALSRLTGLRMFEFKCAWFDEKDYFEFYPLHVIHKLKRARRRKIETQEGIYKINKNPDKIESVKPI